MSDLIYSLGYTSNNVDDMMSANPVMNYPRALFFFFFFFSTSDIFSQNNMNTVSSTSVFTVMQVDR